MFCHITPPPHAFGFVDLRLCVHSLVILMIIHIFFGYVLSLWLNSAVIFDWLCQLPDLRAPEQRLPAKHKTGGRKYRFRQHFKQPHSLEVTQTSELIINRPIRITILNNYFVNLLD